MFIEDYSVFFDVRDFAIDALLTPVDGTPVTIQVIFDAAYYESSFGGGGVGGLKPFCTVADAQLAGVARGATLKIVASTYEIFDIESEGIGTTLLRLKGPIATGGTGSGTGFLLEDGTGGILMEDGSHLLPEDSTPSDGVGLEDGSGGIELEDGSGVLANE